MLHLCTLYDGEVNSMADRVLRMPVVAGSSVSSTVVGFRRTVIGESGRQCGASDAARAEIFTVFGDGIQYFLIQYFLMHLNSHLRLKGLNPLTCTKRQARR